MDATCPAPARIVGSTSTFAAVAALFFVLGWVARFPLPTTGRRPATDGSGGDHTSAARGSHPG